MQTISGNAQELSRKDWLTTGTGLGLAMGLEVYGKSHFVPDEPRFSSPNSFDRFMRRKIWRGVDKQENARLWSDRLHYGMSMSSIVWGPVMAHDSKISLHINSRVFIANSILTNIVKIIAARERPYHHYGTREPEGVTDFTSYFSGHSSIAFSQVVTNAMILTRTYPEYDSMIWTTFLSAAGLTAYLRVAGDMHYFTDILTGAFVGSLIAWSITTYELNRFDKSNEGANAILGNSERRSNFILSLKIPLG